jgi:ABC-2 type transport system ATP-binding protein
VAARRGTTWLERLELGGWAQRKVQDLSKGMQQKVQFAAALIHEPELLILDEPWSGLDPINAEVLREIALEQRAAGRTIVFSTHLMEQAEQICDGVCIIARGRKVVDGSLADVRREAATRRLIAVAFAEGDEIGPRVIADSTAVGSRREQRGFTELELTAEAEASELLSELVGAGADVRRFEVIQPTLHQIFVDKVGAEAARGALPEERLD